jgi:uncharacterized protein YjbI with pentapeptide repeats
MSEFVPQLLSHAELQKMMSDHEVYHARQEGKNGKMLDLTCYIIKDFDFSNQNLVEIDAYNSIFIRCKFIGCDLYHSYFSGSEFIDVDFSDSILVKAELYKRVFEKG